MKPLYLKLFSALGIIFLGIIVYSNTFICSFHFDDIPYIVNNTHIRDIQNLLNIWKICPCRFITFYSLALNYHFHQLDVVGYHIFNLAVHLCSAVLVWWLTLLTLSTPVMKGDKISRNAHWIALLVGLIFVSHPIQTEAVTYIWQRAASMAAMFYLASLCLYAQSRLLQEEGSTSGLARTAYVGSLVMAVLAMFTKENTITLPLMIVLYEFIFFKIKKGFDWKYISPFLLTLLIIPATMLLTNSQRFQEIQGVVDGPGGISPMYYFLTQLRVMMTYIRLDFLPLNLNLDHDYPIFKSIFEWPVLLSSLFLITILFYAQRLFLKYRLISFSIFWFFLTLLPESSFLPQKDVIFEHRLYLPLVGYSLFLASAVYYLFGRNNLKAMLMVLLLIVAGNSVLTYQRNGVWRDEFTLWDDAVSKSPQKARPYNNRGTAYYQRGDFAHAMSDYNKAIEMDPNYAEAYINRGNFYASERNLPQAISDFTKAIEIKPNYAEGYNNRGNIYADEGKLSQAIPDFTKAIEINPVFEEAYNNRGTTYGQLGNLNQAVSDFSEAIEIDPKFAAAYYNRGFAFFYEKVYGKAWEDVRQAQALGAAVNPEFINELKQAGRGSF